MAHAARPKNCPKCGAHSGIHVVGWRLLDASSELETLEKPVPVELSRRVEARGAGVTVLEKEKERIQVTHETYETTYRCSRCGHSWSTESSSFKKTLLEG